MTPEGYVERVKAGKLADPALNAHLKAGYTVKRLLLDFMPDASSLNYATLLEWKNPRFHVEKRMIASPPLQRPVRKVRVCAAQFLMRRISDPAEFEQTVEFFADAANAYHCHFLVLPELFTSQLLYTIPGERETDNPMELMAGYHSRYLELLGELARRYQLYIVGGSTPVRRKRGLYNVAHLFTPTGRVYTQDKLHITPTERDDWNLLPGERLRLFDTPLGRIAIQVCYDIEFPEPSRLLALAGAEIVFVPFSTDERKGYNRVRYTARARAVENYMYVVIAGNAGNLPSIRNYLINYAQSAVFTPSDFAFPLDSLAGQADPNVQNIVVAELDLTTLEQQRELGSVRPFFERRTDLYSIRAGRKIEVVHVE
jgi:predicted amidohydrolase